MVDDGQPPPTQEASTDQRKVAIESSEVITASADYNCEFSIDFTRIAHTHEHSACAAACACVTLILLIPTYTELRPNCGPILWTKLTICHVYLYIDGIHVDD